MKAIRMAEKHEANPSTTTQRRKYRKTIDLRSASGWTKWNLDVFNANFERDQYTDLRRYLGEDAYQMDPQFAEGKLVNIYNSVDISGKYSIASKQDGLKRGTAGVVRG